MIIKDPIYRFITVPKLCKAFMDTPEFQRLRYIKQLGLAFYVYPSAVHTRFEHSLGVMHLAGKAVDILKKQVVITEREKELVQLAGLLHDVGHVALSHLMDYILEEKKVGQTHEERSVMIMKRINKKLKLLTPREEIQVGKMIRGNIKEEKKPFLFEIVCNQSYGLDVDKLDYLQRDSYHTGNPSFQPDYLIECLCVKNNRLAIKGKAKSEIEFMYISRKRLLLLVCRHKTVMIIEGLVRKAIQKLNLINYWKEEKEEKEGRNMPWLKLTDATVQYMMEEECPNIMEKIHTRIWEEEKDKKINPLEHITNVSDKDIKKCMEKILWL